MDYHVKPVGKTCAATGKELAPGSPIYSTLVEQGTQFVRLDYSVEGWTGPAEHEVAYWQTVVPLPEPARARPLDTDALMHQLEQFCESPNAAQEKFAYVIALLLTQKRRLRLDGSRRDGEIEYLQFHGSRGEGSFEVRDQQLTPSEMEQLQLDLNTRLASPLTRPTQEVNMHSKHCRTLARRTQLAIAVALFAVAAVLPGCAFKGGMLGWFHEEPAAALPPNASLSEIVGHLNKSIAQVRAWQSTQVKIVARGNGMPPVRLKAKISVEEPRNFRLMVDAMGNREADLGSNSERFWFWIRRGPNYIFTARHEEIARVAQMPFEPNWVMEALGVVRLHEAELTLERASENDSVVNLVAMRTSPDGRTARHVARVDTHSGHIISHELFDSSNRLMARAELSDYRPETTNGVMLPHEVHLDWPAFDLGLTMYVGEIELNPTDFPAVTWNMPRYRGCKSLDLAHLPPPQRRSIANQPAGGELHAEAPGGTRHDDGGAAPRSDFEHPLNEEEWVPDTVRDDEHSPDGSVPDRSYPRMNAPKGRGSSTSMQRRNWWQKMFGR